jgi:hypothetical protein
MTTTNTNNNYNPLLELEQIWSCVEDDIQDDQINRFNNLYKYLELLVKLRPYIGEALTNHKELTVNEWIVAKRAIKELREFEIALG